MPRDAAYVPRAVRAGNPGAYRDQIRIQRKTVTSQGPTGADIFTWTPVYPAAGVSGALWAAVRQLSASESAKLQQRWAGVSYEIEIQWLPGVEAEMRISWWDGYAHRLLNILGAVDPEGSRRKLWIACEEVKGAV